MNRPASLRLAAPDRNGRRRYDKRRRGTEARSWYKTARWKRMRAAQLDSQPLCRFCLNEGRTTAATICDHIVPHRGDRDLFFDASNLQSLCKAHHDGEKQRIERAGAARLRERAPNWPEKTKG